MYISKRVLIIVGVTAVILIGIFGFVLAYILSQSNSPTANINTIAPTSTITATPKPGVRACALGVITSIQSTGTKSFVVSESKGKQTVTVPPDPRSLARIASESGGSTFTAATASGLKQVYAKLGSQLSHRNAKRQGLDD